jgi:YbgC/YbaW family acyl-CoA thioester hydrolase
MDYVNTVAFDDTDAGGIVFFGNYFRIAHRALEHYLPSIGIPWKNWFGSESLCVPLRHVEADYRAPLFPGEQYRVKVLISKIGETSVSFEFEVLNAQGQSTSTVKTTHVFMDLNSHKKMTIPTDIVTKLKAQMV